MHNSSLNKKTLTIGIFAALAVIMVTGQLAPTMGDSTAFAKSKDKGSNEADQGISQEQSSEQNAQCVSGESIELSCNNLSSKDQSNEGNIASGQQGGDGEGGKGSNEADQGISQEQSSEQNAQCVSGESIELSCNNLSSKDQSNEGNIASGQQGGDGEGGKGSNEADQGISQEQSSEQNAQCVSGEEAIVSCNNAEFQNLVNSGNNALAQD